MKVSIIVPAYNEEKFLARTLESLKAQTYTDFELIVVDNNSTDKTGEIAKTFTGHVFLETTKGYIHAVNRGAKESTGELITFCDADSIYPAGWLHLVVSEFKKAPHAVAVYGSCKTHDSSNRLLNELNGVFYTGFLYLSRFLGLENTSGFNFVMRRNVFFKVGGYNPDYQKMSPDIELGKRIKKEGPIIFNPKIQVYSSFRRFNEGGTFKTSFFFLKSWYEMLMGKEPSTSYDAYNKEIR